MALKRTDLAYAAGIIDGGARTAKEQVMEKEQSLMLRSMHSGKNGGREWRSYRE